MNLVRRVESLELLRRQMVPPPPVPLNQPADVLAVLAEQVAAVRAAVRADVGADPSERARTITGLSAVALRAMESRNVEERLEAVERVLKLRQAADKERNGKKR